MVGTAGFAPAVSRFRSERDNWTSLRPDELESTSGLAPERPVLQTSLRLAIVDENGRGYWSRTSVNGFKARRLAARPIPCRHGGPSGSRAPLQPRIRRCPSLAGTWPMKWRDHTVLPRALRVNSALHRCNALAPLRPVASALQDDFSSGCGGRIRTFDLLGYEPAALLLRHSASRWCSQRESHPSLRLEGPLSSLIDDGNTRWSGRPVLPRRPAGSKPAALLSELRPVEDGGVGGTRTHDGTCVRRVKSPILSLLRHDPVMGRRVFVSCPCRTSREMVGLRGTAPVLMVKSQVHHC